MSEIQNQHTSEDEIDLIELFKKVYKEKKLISGDPEKIKTVYDTWVFAKDINPSNLNWLLIDTIT